MDSLLLLDGFCGYKGFVRRILLQRSSGITAYDWRFRSIDDKHIGVLERSVYTTDTPIEQAISESLVSSPKI